MGIEFGTHMYIIYISQQLGFILNQAWLARKSHRLCVEYLTSWDWWILHSINQQMECRGILSSPEKGLV